MHLSHLIEISQRYFSEMNGTSRALPGLEVLCRHQPSAIEAMIYEPVMCLILQGSKSVSIGDQRVEICPGDALLVGHDLPIVSRITKASLQEPYLALIFSLDLGLVRGLYEQVADASVPQTPARPLAVAPADSAWLAPLARYLDLMDYALDAKVLGPSIRREIHYRLLLSPIGKTLRDLLVADSHASRIARAIQKLRAEFRSTLSVPDLARTAGMSASSFHEHFKSVTGSGRSASPTASRPASQAAARR